MSDDIRNSPDLGAWFALMGAGDRPPLDLGEVTTRPKIALAVLDRDDDHPVVIARINDQPAWHETPHRTIDEARAALRSGPLEPCLPALFGRPVVCTQHEMPTIGGEDR